MTKDHADKVAEAEKAVQVARKSGDEQAFGDALIHYRDLTAWTNNDFAMWNEDGTLFVMASDDETELPEVIGNMSPEEFCKWLCLAKEEDDDD
jgi:hypothetical protein